ncbi:hypothetical protein ABR772_25470 [Bacillus cereus]|uniref:hypothetical protein n=1 Tax=Bacillus cereus TaxID=1396 RepID=UPI00355739F1
MNIKKVTVTDYEVKEQVYCEALKCGSVAKALLITDFIMSENFLKGDYSIENVQKQVGNLLGYLNADNDLERCIEWLESLHDAIAEE